MGVGEKQTTCGLLWRQIATGSFFCHFRGEYFTWSQHTGNKHSQVCTLMSMTHWLKAERSVCSLVDEIKFINKLRQSSKYMYCYAGVSESYPVVCCTRCKFGKPVFFPLAFCFSFDEPWEKRDFSSSLQSSWSKNVEDNRFFLAQLPTAVWERSLGSSPEGRNLRNVDWTWRSDRNNNLN